VLKSGQCGESSGGEFVGTLGFDECERAGGLRSSEEGGERLKSGQRNDLGKNGGGE
jgi:hypothetical protein